MSSDGTVSGRHPGAGNDGQPIALMADRGDKASAIPRCATVITADFGTLRADLDRPAVPLSRQ